MTTEQAQADCIYKTFVQGIDELLTDKEKDTANTVNEFFKLEEVRKCGNVKEVIAALQLGLERQTAE